MSDNDRILEVLTRIEDNQRKALEAQQQHLQIAQAQLDRSNKTIQESVELQRASVARQVQIIRFVIPLTGILLLLLVYLLVKWRVIFY
jgi:hypothetical protein